MKILIILLIALPLLSIAPIPLRPAIVARRVVSAAVVPRAAPVYRVRLAMHRTPRAQSCSYDATETHLRAQVADLLGYPYGFVEAFSCSGDALAVANELATRVAAMQADAAAYRAAHPLKGVTP